MTHSYVCSEFWSPPDPGIPPPCQTTTLLILPLPQLLRSWTRMLLSPSLTQIVQHMLSFPPPKLLEPKLVTMLRQNSSYLCWLQLGLLLRLWFSTRVPRRWLPVSLFQTLQHLLDLLTTRRRSQAGWTLSPTKSCTTLTLKCSTSLLTIVLVAFTVKIWIGVNIIKRFLQVTFEWKHKLECLC